MRLGLGLALVGLVFTVAVCNAQDLQARLVQARALQRSAPDEALQICGELLDSLPHWLAVQQLSASIHCEQGRIALCAFHYEEALHYLSFESVRQSQANHVYPVLHNYGVELKRVLADPSGVKEQADGLPLAKRQRLQWLRHGTAQEVKDRLKEVLSKCSWVGERRTMLDCAGVAIGADASVAVSLLMEALDMPQSEDHVSDGEVYAMAARYAFSPGSVIHRSGEELARKALQLGEVDVVFHLVDFLVNFGRHQDGLPMLAEAVAVSPSLEDDARYWIYRANLLGIAGDRKGSIGMFTEVIRRQDSEYLSSAYHNRAIDFNGIGEYRASHEDHRQAVVTSFQEYTAQPSSNPDCSGRQVHAGFISSLGGIPGLAVSVRYDQQMPVVGLHTRFAKGTPEHYREVYEEQALLPGKQHSFLTMQDVELFGLSRLVVRDCDVIVPNVAMHHFSTMKEPIRGSKGTYLAGKSYIASAHKMSSNYYHLLVDVIPSLEHALQEGSYDHIVFHPSELMDQALDMMGVPIEKREPFLTEAAPIVMDEAVYIDCTGDWDAFNAVTDLAMDEVDTEGEFKFYPSYESVLSVRRAFIPAGHLPAEERTLVIFTHRPPPTSRAVENAELLIDALTQEFGDRFLLHLGKGMTLQEQADLFQHAALIVGPHGAGLTNAIYMGPGSALVELPIPRTRYFGYLAAQIDVDYWVVPEAEGLYEGYYTITPSMASAITATCREAFDQVQANMRRRHAHDEL